MKIRLIFVMMLALILWGCSNGSDYSASSAVTENIPPPKIYFCPSDDCEQAFLDLTKDAESLDCAFFDLDLENQSPISKTW